MDDRPADRVREASTETTRRVVDSTQDVAERAGAYIQARMSGVSERAQDMAQRANARVAELTGRPIESWAADARAAVRQHPLAAVAIAIGLGYLAGKVATRG
ncbi:MAG: hypothetical protein HYU51_06720 [Candidatus Rokubacteria bacterium]|nr:hypothetical protein [Candidatus Rokubacteria bacterium]